MLVERAAAFLDKCVGCPACLSPLPKPYDTVRKDGLLQSIVFRCIPRLYFSEAERRAAFFERNQMAEKVSPLAVSSVTEKPVYVVLDHLQIDELQRRAAGSSAENAEGTANRDGKFRFPLISRLLRCFLSDRFLEVALTGERTQL